MSWASRVNRRGVGKKKRLLVAVGLLTVFILAFWFLCVDLSVFVEFCPTCVYGRDVLQYRVCTIPVHERTWDHVTLLQRVAEDLGVECRHPELMRWHKYRIWGLCIRTAPCIDGINRLSDGDISWYDDDTRARLREMVRANPSLRDEFTERALKNHDGEYWRAFVERLRTLRAETPATTQ